MSRILVTGSNGFVGKHLTRELLARGHQVLGVGGSQAPTDSAEGIEQIILDLTDPKETAKIDFSDITGVVHLAGMAAVGPSFDDPMLYMSVNVGIEVNLFEAAMQQGAHPRFIIISSGTLYDPRAEQPLTEQAPVFPNSPYAVSKLCQEQMAQYYTSRGFEVIIARPFNHIGPGQAPGFIVSDFAQQLIAIEKGEQTDMRVGNLDAQRDYTDVRDIVRAYCLLLEKGSPGETYNICSGKPVSGHEILHGLSKAADQDPKVTQDPNRMRPSDIPILTGAHDKLSQDTGWQPEIILADTLRDVIADWRSK